MNAAHEGHVSKCLRSGDHRKRAGRMRRLRVRSQRHRIQLDLCTFIRVFLSLQACICNKYLHNIFMVH